MGKLLNITETADYLNVSPGTLRKWDKTDKLKSLRTAGGHRRYDTDVLDDFLGRQNANDYGKLYEHLCSAQEIAEFLNYEGVGTIKEIKADVGEKVLSNRAF